VTSPAPNPDRPSPNQARLAPNEGRLGPNQARLGPTQGRLSSDKGRPPSQYASTPHLFVYQSVDDDATDSDEAGDDSDNDEQVHGEAPRKPGDVSINMANLTLSPAPKTNTLGENVATVAAASSRTLPRQLPATSQKEPIYSSTAAIKTHVVSGKEAAGSSPPSDPYGVPSASLARRSSSCNMIDQDSFAVTNQVVARIETSFRGHKTQIWTCRTMANLYTEEGSGKDAKWNLKFTGVPALLLDLGETKSRDKRKLQILLAEKESGFELWRDTVDNLTSYKVQEANFHILYLSSDHRRKIGLSFNEGDAAMIFHKQLETLTSDPENISLSGPSKKKSKSKEKIIKYKPPKKTDISKPCNFHHVTTVEPTDSMRLYSMKVYASGGSPGGEDPGPLTPLTPLTPVSQPPVTPV